MGRRKIKIEVRGGQRVRERGMLATIRYHIGSFFFDGLALVLGGSIHTCLGRIEWRN
jgi:hypothetical protein